MQNRFAFRQIDRRDLSLFLHDQEIRSKKHSVPQRCHQTSYQNIVDFRDTTAFAMPLGGVVNDYVPFYFSPITAFSYVINRGDVQVSCPKLKPLGNSSLTDRLFLVSRVDEIFKSGLDVCFSNYALNSMAPMPSITADKSLFDSHIRWNLFDETPLIAEINEIGYKGVCRYFFDSDTPPSRHNRKSARMAELLIKNSFPTSLLCCIIAPNAKSASESLEVAKSHGFLGQVISKEHCFIS